MRATPVRPCETASATSTAGAANEDGRNTSSPARFSWARLRAPPRNGAPGVALPDRAPGKGLAGTSIATGRKRRLETPQAQPDPAPAVPDARSATGRIRGDAQGAGRGPRSGDPRSDSTANVTAYLRLQQETLQRATAFSDAFRRTVWATPEVDYTLKRPVGALAKRLWSDERRAEVAASLAKLGERYGLIYLGHTDCGGCKVFGPLLRAFAIPPRSRRARRVADRRAARRLAGGGAGQRAGGKTWSRWHAGARGGAVRHADQSMCCRSASASWPRTSSRNGYSPSQRWSPAMITELRKGALCAAILVQSLFDGDSAGQGRRALGDEPLLAGRGGQHHRADGVPGPGVGSLDAGQPLSPLTGALGADRDSEPAQLPGWLRRHRRLRRRVLVHQLATS